MSEQKVRSDDGDCDGTGGDDYDYGGPSFNEDAFVRPVPFNSLSIFSCSYLG